MLGATVARGRNDTQLTQPYATQFNESRFWFDECGHGRVVAPSTFGHNQTFRLSI